MVLPDVISARKWDCQFGDERAFYHSITKCQIFREEKQDYFLPFKIMSSPLHTSCSIWPRRSHSWSPPYLAFPHSLDRYLESVVSLPGTSEQTDQLPQPIQFPSEMQCRLDNIILQKSALKAHLNYTRKLKDILTIFEKSFFSKQAS